MAIRRVLMATFTALASLVPAGAETPPLKPLPGSATCTYPTDAQRNFVAGPVLFTAQVRPDGRVKSVDIRQVPATGLGFEQAVRACVLEWRFEPAGRKGGLRPYEGKIRYRMAATANEEAAIRGLLEAFAAAWNAERPDPEAILGSPSLLAEQFTKERAAADWNMDLDPDFEEAHFLRPDLAVVTQRFHRGTRAGAGSPADGESSLLEATAIKRGGWWRLFAWSSVAGRPSGRQRLVPGIEEPRKITHVDPVYPDLGRQARVSAVVILEFEVDTQGKVTSVKILRGHPIFDEAAIKAVQKWEYAPTLFEGTATPVVRRATIDFSLDEGVSLYLPLGLVRVREDLVFRLLVASSQPRP
jgi:TonB family protein